MARPITLRRYKNTQGHPELNMFKKYLMGLAGKKKGEKAANAIVKDNIPPQPILICIMLADSKFTAGCSVTISSGLGLFDISIALV